MSDREEPVEVNPDAEYDQGWADGVKTVKLNEDAARKEGFVEGVTLGFREGFKLGREI